MTVMDSTNQDKPSSSVKLDGFAPASGSGAASSFMTGPTAASASASASAAGGISSTSTSTTPSASSAGSIGTSTKKPPSANAVATKTKQRTNAKKKLNKNKNNNGGSATASSSAASSSETTTNNNKNNNDNDTEEATILRPLSEVDSSFTPLSLPQIQLRLRSLLEKLPRDLPAVLPPAASTEAIDVRHAPVKSFASALQIVVEEYNLLLSLVSCATYRWGVDRSGASQQNLSVMSAELQQCQEVISNVVSARLSNVLCPAVDVVVGEVEVVRTGKGGGDGDDNNNDSGNGNNGELATKKRKLNEDRLSTGDGGGGNGGDGANNERRINHYARPLVDPSYVHLCHRILARNAPLIRHTVATSLYTAQRVIGDYLKAMKKDSSHDSSKGGYY
mmetsp:Transcript_23826/g.51540  ORF Transcript_23826/g.51540 Transcript_23826/m.51540 type:complete len:391 (+) Transcript_23826:92-1264(+)